MVKKRYALLVTSSASFAGEQGQEIPSESLSASRELIRQSITSLDNYSFGWPDKRTGELRQPLALSRSPWSSFVETLEQHEKYIGDDTLFLFYYFGHGVVHDNQLHVAFGDSQVGNARKRTLSEIVDELYNVGVRNLIIIADNCHAGLARQDFQVQRDGLQYYVLAASRTGYTRYDLRGGQWTLALSQTLERWRRPAVIDRGLGYGTFQKWFDRARETAQTGTRLAPFSIDGGLANHVLFAVEEHSIPSHVLGGRTERTIYNRLYLLLCMLNEQSQSTRELQTRMQDEAWRVFLIASATSSEDSARYISLDAIDRYLAHATHWQIVTRDTDASKRFSLTAQGREALAQSGKRYNSLLCESIYRYLSTHSISRDFLIATMRKIIRAYDVPNVKALLREIQYTSGVRSLDRPTLEFALRMLSQSKDFQKNTGDAFFPVDPLIE